MKKRYFRPEVEHINIIAMQRLMQGTGGGLLPGNGQGDAIDPFSGSGSGAPYRY